MRKPLMKAQSGSAAAEMALVAPLLITLMFGSMELGYYFFSEHVVVKAVRDGARFASRQSFSQYACPAGTVEPTATGLIRNVTRTDQITPQGTPRLSYWTDGNATIFVTLRCDISGAYGSIYTGMDAVPVVSVRAEVPYRSLFSQLGFNATQLKLNAQSEVPVMGI
jgi:hypothetical protein